MFETEPMKTEGIERRRVTSMGNVLGGAEMSN